MRPGVLAIGPNCRQRRAFRDRRGSGGILPSHLGAKRMTDRKHRERLRVVRVDGDGLFE